MDYSKFTDENFDLKEWVNAAFSAQKEGPKDQYATTLVMKLQMFIQEVNNVVEESCQQAVNNLPRVSRELEAVRQEGALLQDQMRSVKHDIEKVEQETSQSMQTLLRLDALKGRMGAASAALQEADNWTTLAADVDDVFDSGDVQAIAEKLVGMQQSLQMLTDVADYGERCQFLETLKNRLEATLSPAVVAAFSAHSLDASKMYVGIFSDIGRLSQLYKYYHKCHKGSLVEQWRRLQSEPLPAALAAFLDVLLSRGHSELAWCAQVFPAPAPVVADLLSEVLEALQPAMPACLDAHLQTPAAAADPLAEIIALKQVSARFAKSIESAIDSHAGQTDPAAAALSRLGAAVYAPYAAPVRGYGALEAETLRAALDAIPLDAGEPADAVSLLADSTAKLFAAAAKANERCQELSHGCGYLGLLDSLQGYLSDYLREFRRVLTNLREKCRVDSELVDTDDWPLFQNSLKLVQTCGDLLLHTDELDQELVAGIESSLSRHYPAPRPEARRSPMEDWPRLLLASPADRQALHRLVDRLQEGDSPTVLEAVRQEVCALSELVHQFAFDIVFSPLRQQLALVPSLEMWTSSSAGGAITSNLPTFSLSPQEYITKIGQYLMTVPQQLEPYSLEDNPMLAAALRHANLPYAPEQASAPEQLAAVWLEAVARGAMHVYAEQVLLVPQLSAHAAKQLVTDIEYLCNVLEDLGLSASPALTALAALLRAGPDEFPAAAERHPQRLAGAVATMRGLSLH